MKDDLKMRILIKLAFALMLLVSSRPVSSSDLATAGSSSFFKVASPWSWICDEQTQFCVKTLIKDKTLQGTSHAACQLTCHSSAVIWPKPTTDPILSKSLVLFRAEQVRITKSASPSSQVDGILKQAGDIFLNIIHQIALAGSGDSESRCSADSCINNQLNVEILVSQNDSLITTKTDESYRLNISTDGTITTCYIVAPTFFGARHALETLSQLIAWDDLLDSLIIVKEAVVTDRPVFAHRGLMIDTVRNYLEVSQIKKIIEGMSYDKLNTLHWHITDSQSFPFVSNREPLMAVYGAYSPRHVYKPQDIQELVQYAQIRGVRIIPELDAPSHVGAGWEWGSTYGLGDLALCYTKQTVSDYCTAPPCSVLNPINDNTYKVINNIYRDMADLFQSDVFHMGGDEVKVVCWNETKEVLDYMSQQGWGRELEDFYEMWKEFQNRALDELDQAFGREQDVVFWTSGLTEEGRAPNYLDKNRYIIQFWENADDPSTKILIEQGYRLIMSNSDALYLDCGYSAWIGDLPNNWCSPYKGWQLIYDNSPRKIVENFGLVYENHAQQFLGGEAAMWSEQVRGVAIESKLWPRASALAERLWNDPITGWKDAEPRILAHRERIAERGIGADVLQPFFCNQNGGSCSPAIV